MLRTNTWAAVKGISKSRTHQASRDRLVCAITIKLDGRNAKSRVQFKYILQNGKGDQIFETLQ